MSETARRTLDALLADESTAPQEVHPVMTFTTAHLSISLDGFVAGPDQSLDDPIGVRGLELHRWHLGDLARRASGGRGDDRASCCGPGAPT